jgi:hypothetical protein
LEEDWNINQHERGIMHALNLDPRNMPHISITTSPLSSAPSRWFPHPLNFIKLNIDGGSKGNSGMVGYGGIFKSDNGTILRNFVGKLGLDKNNVTQIKALEEGLKITINECYTRLVTEDDS